MAPGMMQQHPPHHPPHHPQHPHQKHPQMYQGQHLPQGPNLGVPYHQDQHQMVHHHAQQNYQQQHQAYQGGPMVFSPMQQVYLPGQAVPSSIAPGSTGPKGTSMYTIPGASAEGGNDALAALLARQKELMAMQQRISQQLRDPVSNDIDQVGAQPFQQATAPLQPIFPSAPVPGHEFDHDALFEDFEEEDDPNLPPEAVAAQAFAFGDKKEGGQYGALGLQSVLYAEAEALPTNMDLEDEGYYKPGDLFDQLEEAADLLGTVEERSSME
eukprot:CAMPEP_0183300434 /NCGR_PEP_ID=MMETSP0160_2-20130417/6871_1 /TAXON_ID=2839 ORGANISM="Odontella Sinensis, Strain Grunow 1884" /NCGR_SAMPLE_ID=MMETSP0160_2 /ASSEMBLY_ACC=CAM_ASM_000250 /LENGTH=268 /DNA_ID=CAMNT_0025462857 /DNA_START=68 /DNA_END=874 /DNA_ORIENTATION=+